MNSVDERRVTLKRLLEKARTAGEPEWTVDDLRKFIAESEECKLTSRKTQNDYVRTLNVILKLPWTQSFPEYSAADKKPRSEMPSRLVV